MTPRVRGLTITVAALVMATVVSAQGPQNAEDLPASLFHSGEALRLGRRCPEALDQYLSLSFMYPEHPQTMKALLGAAVCQVQTGRALAAVETLQRLRAQFPETPEAATALDWNTILFRLYVRAPKSMPPFEYQGPLAAAAKLKKVSAMSFDRAGRLLIAHQGGVSIFSAQGDLEKMIPANFPSAIGYASGTRAVATKNLLVLETSEAPVLLEAPQPNGESRPLDDIVAVAGTWQGDWLVADSNRDAV